MEKYINILDGNILHNNIKFAALFIMNFECLKDYVVSQMISFFSDDYELVDGELKTLESQTYRDTVNTLDPKHRNKLTAALLWFESLEAITQDDISLFYKARARRNSITHELANELLKGFSEDDAQLFASMISLYRKIDKWWINEIEIPIARAAGDIINDEYDPTTVFGGQALILSLINDVALDESKEAHKELLSIIREHIS